MKKVTSLLWITVFSLILFSTSTFGDTLIVNYFQGDDRYVYQKHLIQLALNKTLDDGPFELRKYKGIVNQFRGRIFMKQGKVDIIFQSPTDELEREFRSIKFPMLRGILGYRIFLIHKDSIDAFAKIKTFKELRTKYKAGFGSDWGDMAILKENNVKVHGTPLYESLFKMLEVKRFDYFPRGINEVHMEYEKFKAKCCPNILVEPNLAFFYSFPLYFYVQKSNTRLADRLERGLKIAEKDGSFNKLFMEFYGNYIQQGNIGKRKVFMLTNSSLPKNIPDVDTSWWLKER